MPVLLQHHTPAREVILRSKSASAGGLSDAAKMHVLLRRPVLAAAQRRAAKGERRVHVSWATLHALKGLVRLGGNAVEDCRRLYDE
jgi:hypothetical protein